MESRFIDEFEVWWDDLSEAEQDDIAAVVGLLEESGPTLPFPFSSNVSSSRHGNMRELRIQHQGDPFRVLYAFDPRRCAILLIGGKKAGDDRWYDKNVPIADKLYNQHLKSISQGKGE